MTQDSNFGNLELPIVTVFGAGIAGLTAAHELVERGFQVQVVEPSRSPTSEYECSVGGLAANQFSRVRAPIQALHPWLMTDENRPNLAHALKFRDGNAGIEATAKRYPLNQKLRFDRQQHRPGALQGPLVGYFDARIRSRREPKAPAPADWKKYWDAHGVLNEAKLDQIYYTIHRASRHYMRLYFPKLTAALDKNPELKPENWAEFCPIHDTDANAREFIARETFFVRIVAYTDADATQEENRIIAAYWAEEVRDALLARDARRQQDLREADVKTEAFVNQAVWELERRLEIVVRGSADAQPTADPRQRSLVNRVEFEVVEQIIPGEHGFRFFPGFYRHLFDTMKRTPAFNERGLAEGSAFDQLITTPRPQLSLGGGLHNFDFRNIASFSEAREATDLMFGKVGFKPKDVLGLQVKTFRFLTSGPKRREKEAEPINLIEYLGGKEPEKLFTPQCFDFIDRAPRALAAMSASESDARSQYSITIQLGLKSLPDPATLNGPTSIAWLDPWKAYLKRQGVKFFIGRLIDLEPRTIAGENIMRLVPVTQGPRADGDTPSEPLPEDPDDIYQHPRDEAGFSHRFVLAAQFQDSSDIAWKARARFQQLGARFEGPFAQMVAFDIASGRRQSGDAQARLPERNAVTGKEALTWPARTISGAQFFFAQSYRFGRSNIYFSFTPYALTSISQYAFWRQHSGPVGQLLGQISIDIGDWHSPYPAADVTKQRGPGHPAFYSSSQEVAQGTWEQVVSGLPAAYAGVIRPPRYYHLDQNMVFRDARISKGEPGWMLTGGVRANTILRVPENTNPAASLALVPGRAYSAEFRVGQGGEPIGTGPVKYDAGDKTSLRDTLFEDLLSQAVGRLLMTRFNDHDIVVSPLARQKAVTLRVLGPSNAPFRLVVDWLDISLDATGRDPPGIINALVDALDKRGRELVQVTRPAPDCLTLTPAKGEMVSVGVLNVDRKIELVGAPALIVKALNLEVVEPAEGFALIRNDYQYIIDIPGQWAFRPGLRRDPGGVPEDFVELAQTFGVKRPEIYYAHPETCPLLEYWVGAGAHMATYTRMTTMESANESGRHAAAALIYEIRGAARRQHVRHYEALAGDFPSIFPVEDNEGDDIEFFKKLDDQLFDMGEPHLFEILGITKLVEKIQRGEFSRTEIEAKLQPLLAGLPGLTFAAPGFAGKLGALLLRMWANKG
jgi:hypothetical protein